jgi:CO/xanthine dehydrogenase FAD-binding subunit
LFFRPTTIDEAVAALANQGGQILAGGTDFFPALNGGPVRQPVIDIGRIDELRGIQTLPDRIRIGAATSWSEFIAHPLPTCFDGLKAAAREVGSLQIQNAGTIGGNLCNASPAADGVPPLLALDAEIELAGPSGRRTLKLTDFLTGYRATAKRPDEILTAILVPCTIDQGRSSFLKLGGRRYLIISIAMVAAIIEIEGGVVVQARIAIGACSTVALRLPELEQALIGAPAKPGLGALATAKHLTALAPIDDLRATAEYRRDAALTLIRRALDLCVAGAG